VIQVCKISHQNCLLDNQFGFFINSMISLRNGWPILSKMSLLTTVLSKSFSVIFFPANLYAFQHILSCFSLSTSSKVSSINFLAEKQANLSAWITWKARKERQLKTSAECRMLNLLSLIVRIMKQVSQFFLTLKHSLNSLKRCP